MTRNKSTKSEIFPVTSRTKLNAHTHTKEHTHTEEHTSKNTHTQEHTYRNTHTHRNTHTSGQGRVAITEGPEEQGLGLWLCARAVPHARPPTPGTAPARLPPALPPSGAKVQCRGWGCILTRGAHLQQVEPVWTQPSEFCSSVLGLAWRSRVGTATEHRSLCSHWALALAFHSPSHRGGLCQHNLRRIDLWPA